MQINIYVSIFINLLILILSISELGNFIINIDHIFFNKKNLERNIFLEKKLKLQTIKIYNIKNTNYLAYSIGNKIYINKDNNLVFKSLLAVIFHEIGHIKNKDTLLVQLIITYNILHIIILIIIMLKLKIFSITLILLIIIFYYIIINRMLNSVWYNIIDREIMADKYVKSKGMKLELEKLLNSIINEDLEKKLKFEDKEILEYRIEKLNE